MTDHQQMFTVLFRVYGKGSNELIRRQLPYIPRVGEFVVLDLDEDPLVVHAVSYEALLHPQDDSVHGMGPFAVGIQLVERNSPEQKLRRG